jgi:hypothetical protein
MAQIMLPGQVRNGAREGGDEEDREPGEPAGDLLQAPPGIAQESPRARRPLRRGARRDHLLRERQAVRVLQPALQVSACLLAGFIFS